MTSALPCVIILDMETTTTKEEQMPAKNLTETQALHQASLEMIVAALQARCGDATTFEARNDARDILDEAFNTWARETQS